MCFCPPVCPYIVSGLKQGWAFAWRSLITAEMLYLSLGLGQLLMMGRDLNDMSQVIAVMILIIALGYIVDGLVFKTIERRLAAQVGVSIWQRQYRPATQASSNKSAGSPINKGCLRRYNESNISL